MKEWLQQQIISINHTLSIQPTIKDEKLKNKPQGLLAIENESFNNTSNQMLMQKKSSFLDVIQPLKLIIPAYSWFQSQQDPSKCISKYNINYKIVKNIRIRMHQYYISNCYIQKLSNQKGQSEDTLQKFNPKEAISRGRFNENLYFVICKANQKLPNNIAQEVQVPHINNRIRLDFSGLRNFQRVQQDAESQISENENGGEVSQLIRDEDPSQGEIERMARAENQSLFQSSFSQEDNNSEQDETISENADEDIGSDDDILNQRQRAQSLGGATTQNLSSNDGASQRGSKEVRRRKDPLFNTNRFKFTQAEDEILRAEIMAQVEFSKATLFSHPDKFNLQSIQERFFEQRPVFELVRRCCELIDQDKYPLPNQRAQTNPAFAQLQNHLNHRQSNEESKFTTRSKHTQHAVNSDRPWQPEEEELLKQAVQKHGNKSWLEISNYLTSRTAFQCRYHFGKINPSKQIKGVWEDPINDIKLLIGLKLFGKKSWAEISQYMFRRTISDLQCNERYNNILDEKISQDKWTEEEIIKLTAAVQKHGQNKWAKIAAELGNKRTDNQCKRRYKAEILKTEKGKANQIKRYRKILQKEEQKQDSLQSEKSSEKEVKVTKSKKKLGQRKLPSIPDQQRIVMSKYLKVDNFLDENTQLDDDLPVYIQNIQFTTLPKKRKDVFYIHRGTLIQSTNEVSSDENDA